MTFCFHTLGCKLNFAETSDIARQLRQKGYVQASQGEPADVVLLNTCSVTDVADHKGRLTINRLHRENPNALLVVTGCYAQLKPQEVADIKGVDLVLGNSQKAQAAEIIDEALRMPRDKKILSSDILQEHTFVPSVSSEDRTRYFLKIQDGCDYHCTYCTIPLARGASRSATVEHVLGAVMDIAAKGAKEIVLTGVNTGDFGRQNSEDFFSLLRRLEALDIDVRYRISSIEPNLLTDQIIDFVAHSRHFAPHFHVPLQSGSDAVLRLMKRRYNTDMFRRKMLAIKQAMPHAFIGVDLMVGVRGETEQDFTLAQQFVQSLPISQLHVFTYSERANTPMLDITPIVPRAERKRRSEIMHLISEQKRQQFYQQNKGRQAIVLWESKQQNGMMSGFTDNYVRISRPYDSALVNTFQTVVI